MIPCKCQTANVRAFIFAVRSPKTREKCIGRLRAFLDFVEVPQWAMTERRKIFCERGKKDIASNNDSGNGWVFASIVPFIKSNSSAFLTAL
ncbi:MAG: hypothetical protein WAJ93_21895 [Candidatus Nitrosopolaris sp.]